MCDTIKPLRELDQAGYQNNFFLEFKILHLGFRVMTLDDDF